MGGDPRAKHFRRLRRLRRAARRWSVIGATLAGATAVLLPYHGIGLPDVFWAAGAGGSVALAFWRWSDFRVLNAQEPPPALPAADPITKVVGMLTRHPAGKAAVDQLRRHRSKAQLRGTVAAEAAGQIDRASATMAGLAGRLAGPVESIVSEAAAAEALLWDLAQRAAGVEKARQFAPADTHASLDAARDELLGQLGNGVAAYERLVAAAAEYVAEDGRTHPHSTTASSSLNDAADKLRGYARGLAEARDLGRV
ncbi:phage shock envelope stress response protein PspM [Longispora albida]|uniref:phage shock envelope stress response protein PspM n=1 Tax=Longispora albida TaxID=203523 RepID=UPI0003761D0A|nr:hypothetical protein [Longispora albida]